MKYQKHYLSEEGKFNKLCPLSGGDHDIQCDSFCAWFDHEDQDCRKILALEDIVHELRKEKEVKTQHVKRTFKF